MQNANACEQLRMRGIHTHEFYMDGAENISGEDLESRAGETLVLGSCGRRRSDAERRRSFVSRAILRATSSSAGARRRPKGTALLLELRVENYAVIDSVVVEFGPGL